MIVRATEYQCTSSCRRGWLQVLRPRQADLLGEFDWLPFNGGNLYMEYVEESEVVAAGTSMTWMQPESTLWLTSHGNALTNIW